MNTSEYNVSLDITKQYLENSVGYSSYEATNLADKQLLRQNNIIMCLLEQIIKKLNDKNNQTNEINDLVAKIYN